MAAKLVEIIRINNRKPFIFQYFTESFAFGSFAGENEAKPIGDLSKKGNSVFDFRKEKHIN